MRIHSVSAVNNRRANFTNPKTPKFGVFYVDKSKKVDMMIFQSLEDGKCYEAYKELRKMIETNSDIASFNGEYSLNIFFDCEPKFRLLPSIGGVALSDISATDVCNPEIREKIVNNMAKLIKY